MNDTAAAALALRSHGMPLSQIAGAIARDLGLTPTVRVRQRLAARLRKRLERLRVTAGHANLRPPPVTAAAVALPSKVEGKEAKMARLIRKKTTIEVIADADEVDIDEALADSDGDDEDEGSEDDSEDESAQKRKRRR